MKITQTNDSTQFKWNRATHLEMTMMSLENINLDKISKRQIARYSQMPDFSKKELGFYNNTHFFFPNSKKASFGINYKNFNALEKFKQHLIETLKSDNVDLFFRNLGYTLHYLQDMSVPLHTEPSNTLEKIIKYRTHAEFEKGKKYGATRNIKSLKENYSAQKLDNNSFIDLFINTAKFSQKPQYKVTRFNKNKWLQIQQDCFSRGVNASSEFIEKIFQIKEDILQNL